MEFVLSNSSEIILHSYPAENVEIDCHVHHNEQRVGLHKS